MPAYAAVLLLFLGTLPGCGLPQDAGTSGPVAALSPADGTGKSQTVYGDQAESLIESKAGNTKDLRQTVPEGEMDTDLGQDRAVPVPDRISFTDVKGQTYTFSVNPVIARHEYDLQAFVRDEDRLSYVGDTGFCSRLGLDVSHYHGTIDWEKVKEDGFSFAFIRLGCRGYGEAGEIRLDREFKNNMENALAAGLDVGVYFFSQAVNEEEAVEEAAFVLKNLEGYQLQLPVVFDPERIDWDEARTDCVSGRQFTENAEAFCSMVEEAGFAPMLYCNLYWQAFELDLERLSRIPIWYADYEKLPQTPYRFAFWQYTNEGSVDGITGPVDLNIQLIPAAPPAYMPPKSMRNGMPCP